MNIARLAATGAVVGVAALGMAGTASASPSPHPKPFAKETGNPAPSGDFTDSYSPNPFHPGQTVTWTVKCPVKPSLSDKNNLFTGSTGFTGSADKGWKNKTTARKTVAHSMYYNVDVTCGKYVRHHKFYITKPPTHPTNSPTPKPSSTVPSGAPQTGDGSSNGGGNTPLIAAGGAIVIAGLAGGGFMAARRRSERA